MSCSLRFLKCGELFKFFVRLEKILNEVGAAGKSVVICFVVQTGLIVSLTSGASVILLESQNYLLFPC